MLIKKVLSMAVAAASSAAWGNMEATPTPAAGFLLDLVKLSNTSAILNMPDRSTTNDEDTLIDLVCRVSSSPAMEKDPHAIRMEEVTRLFNESVNNTMMFARNTINPLTRSMLGEINSAITSGAAVDEEIEIVMVDLPSLYTSDDLLSIFSGLIDDYKTVLSSEASQVLRGAFYELPPSEQVKTGISTVDELIIPLVAENTYYEFISDPVVWSAANATKFGFLDLIISALFVDRVIRGEVEALDFEALPAPVRGSILDFRRRIFTATAISIGNIRTVWDAAWLSIAMPAASCCYVRKRNWDSWTPDSEMKRRDLYQVWCTHPKKRPVGDEKGNLNDPEFIKELERKANANRKRREMEINANLENIVHRTATKVLRKHIEDHVADTMRPEMYAEVAEAIRKNPYVQVRDNLRDWCRKVICTTLDKEHDTLEFLTHMEAVMAEDASYTTEDASLIALVYLLSDTIACFVEWKNV